METVKALFKKYQSIIMYLIFGGLTTAVNWGVYVAAFNLLHIPNIPSTVIAWILAVIFAYVTNKLWVFESKSWDGKTVFREATAFLAARGLSGVMDVAVMWAAVDVAGWNNMLWKLISNVLVVIVNYFASKFVIFRKK